MVACRGVHQGGGFLRNPIPWGVLNPPPFFKNGPRGGFKGVFRRTHIICAIFFFWCCSFGLHIQSFVLAPNSATFDFVPLARDPPQCKGDVAFPPFFLTFLILPPALKRWGSPIRQG